MMACPPHGHSTLRAACGCLSRGKPPAPGCVMDNHFDLLVRVPHRPEGFEVPLELVVARLERALGVESAKRMHRRAPEGAALFQGLRGGLFQLIW